MRLIFGVLPKLIITKLTRFAPRGLVSASSRPDGESLASSSQGG